MEKGRTSQLLIPGRRGKVAAKPSKFAKISARRAHCRKAPFFFEKAFPKLEHAIRSYKPAAMFDLFARGYDSLFEQAVGCVISTRTLDEVTVPAALRLFHLARAPGDLLNLSTKEIDTAISPCTFHGAKAHQLHELARAWAGREPGANPSAAELEELPGIGPKCASLILGVTGIRPAISVDVHVHRITNRWGIVHTKVPQETMKALETRVPHRYWIDVNRLLVPFGKHICTRLSPFCSRCPVLEMCLQIGVHHPR